MRGSDSQPKLVKLLFRYAVTIIRHDNPIVFDVYPAGVRIRIVGILHEFGQRDVRPSNQALSQLAEQSGIYGEVCEFHRFTRPKQVLPRYVSAAVCFRLVLQRRT